jgi:hypothetical protein
METQTTSSRCPTSSLFTVRLWMEEMAAGEYEVRMVVRHVLSGETCYFRSWPDVVAFLLSKLPAPGDEGGGEGGDRPQEETK